MSVVSFALAVIFIIRLFSTSVFRVPKVFVVGKFLVGHLQVIIAFVFKFHSFYDIVGGEIK